ncbi:MAG: hypothetical protein J1G07_06175 [Clostridiales bacterium]|nr:hypothetical protein [Clostridiales bacterium]
MTSLNMIPQIRAGVRFRDEEFGCLVFTNRTPILSFDNDAAKILHLVDGQSSIGDIAKQLSGMGYIETEKVVTDFIETCIKLDLIEII